MKKTLLVIVLLAMGCKSNADKHIEFIAGYWEIESVYKDNQLLRTFKINSGIDYFKINADLKGFRKKLKPNFNGTFETSKDILNFKIEIKNNVLLLNYIDNGTSYFEEVLLVNDKKLVLKNRFGLIYHYVPYELLDLSQ
jgi:hypothetical protein